MDQFDSVETQGPRLIQAGWKQGVVIPALSYGVAFKPQAPGTELSETVSLQYTRRDDVPDHQLAISYTGKRNSKLVVISQTCDIRSDAEPFVMAMPVEVVRNPEYLRRARNSSRQFVLDEAKGFIVNGRVVVMIEKALLGTLIPERGAPDAAAERALARWLARRFARAAHPDRFVAAVRDPIQSYIQTLRDGRDTRTIAMDQIDIRVVPPASASSPFDVHLILVTGESITESEAAALATCIPELRALLIDPAIGSVSIDVVPFRELSALDYLATDELLGD